MTTILLIRHGMTAMVGHRMTGRMPGVSLTAEGLKQVEAVGERLRREPIEALYSSPMERALQTAGAIASRSHLEVQTDERLTEIDFGEWSGKDLEELDRRPDWKRFNAYRSGVRAPGGEHTMEIQLRMMSFLEQIREEYDGKVVAAVSHADPIRAVVAHYLGVPLDLFHRIVVEPASITRLHLHEWGPQIFGLNERCF